MTQAHSTYSRIVSKTALCAQAFLFACGLFVIAASLVGFFGDIEILFDLFSHFHLQYTVILALSSALAFGLKKPQLAWIFAGTSACNAAMLLMLWIPQGTPKADLTQPSQSISILNMNLNYDNRRPDMVVAEIERLKPDVLVLEELTPSLFSGMKAALDKFKYSNYVLRPDPYGIGIFSHLPMTNKSTDPLDLVIPLVMRADITVGKTNVAVFGVHTLTPLVQRNCDFNNTLADRLTAYRSKLPKSVVLIGDMNATPWSHTFRRLLATNEFVDSERGFGLQCSWPYDRLQLLMIPIDHAFVTPDISVVTRELGHDDGSDHLPLFVRLTIPQ